MAIKPREIEPSEQVKALLIKLENASKANRNKNRLKTNKSTQIPTKKIEPSEAVKALLIKLENTSKANGNNNSLQADWFSETNLKTTANDLKLIVAPGSYAFEIDESTFTDFNGTRYYGIKELDEPIPQCPVEAKEALALYRATIPPEVLKGSLKYLDYQTKKIILNWVIEANNQQNRVNQSDINTHLSGIKSDPHQISGKVLDNIRYKLIKDNESFTEAIASLKDAKVYGIDTETTGLDPHLHKLRLIQIASENNPTIIIDCYKCDVKLIQPLLINDSIKVFHNAKFDLQFFLALGLEINQKIFDTQLAYQLIKAGGEGNIEYSLQALSKELLNINLDKSEQVSDWISDTLTDEQLTYAAKDAEILLPLREKLKEQLKSANLNQVAKIEFDCTLAVAMMEYNGMLLDLAKWQSILKDTLTKKNKVEAELKQILKIETNQLTLFKTTNNLDLDSPKQVKEALNNLGIKVESTSFKTLAKLAPDYQVIKLLLEYRKLSKLLSSFGDSLTKKINPVTGRLHASYWQCGSSAGRFSCSNPNLQQIPRNKEIRSCFVASPGNKLIIADYSQIELRIAAEVANDQTMIQAYNQGQDLHKLTASLILHKPIDEVTKEDRQIAKSANFGLIYGASVHGFRMYAENNYGIKLSENEAGKIMDNFFKAYSGLAKWHKSTKNQLYRQGISESRTLANRRRLFSKASPQQALNTPIQGTGADMLKLALAKLPLALKGKDVQILATVHDEIILEVREEIADKVADILSDTMREAGEEFLKLVPVEAEASIGNNWSDK